MSVSPRPTPDGTLAMDDIDTAVEAACRLFLATKALLNSDAEATESGPRGEELATHVDFIEGMVFATSRLIREARGKDNGVNVYDSNYVPYDDVTAMAYSVLGKTCAKYWMTVDEMGLDTCEGMFGQDTVPDAPNDTCLVAVDVVGLDTCEEMFVQDAVTVAPNDMEHDQGGSHLLVGGGVGGVELAARMSDGGGGMREEVVEVSRSDGLAYELEAIPQDIHEERLGRILRRLVDGRKLGVKSLWVCAYKTKLESHEMEEDYAFWRLLSGYDAPNHDLIAHYFESFVGVEATFKDQVNADKRAVKMGWAERIEHREELVGHVRGAHATQNLIHNILNTILQLKLAIDWAKMSEDSRVEYVNNYFEEANVDEIAAMKSRVSSREFKRWYSQERTLFLESHEKYMAARKWTLTLYEEFGSVVLLDSRWNPSKFGMDSRSDSFVSFLVFLLGNVPRRRATSDELFGHGGHVKYVNGRGTVKYNTGTHKDNDALVLTIVKYITRKNDVVAYVEDFIKRTSKGK